MVIAVRVDGFNAASLHPLQYLGAFENIDDAIKTRKVAEEKYYGEFKYDKNRDYRFRNDKNEVSYG